MYCRECGVYIRSRGGIRNSMKRKRTKSALKSWLWEGFERSLKSVHGRGWRSAIACGSAGTGKVVCDFTFEIGFWKRHRSRSRASGVPDWVLTLFICVFLGFVSTFVFRVMIRDFLLLTFRFDSLDFEDTGACVVFSWPDFGWTDIYTSIYCTGLCLFIKWLLD